MNFYFDGSIVPIVGKRIFVGIGINVVLGVSISVVIEVVTERKEYVSGMEIKSAVYFEANATFGESGGEIRYSLDNGHTWETYDGVLTVKREAYVKCPLCCENGQA